MDADDPSLGEATSPPHSRQTSGGLLAPTLAPLPQAHAGIRHRAGSRSAAEESAEALEEAVCFSFSFAK